MFYGETKGTYADSGGTYTATVPAKVPELELERERLDKVITELEENLKGLEARLDSVLLPSTANAKILDTDSRVSEPHSQTVMHLRSMFAKVRTMNDRLNYLKERLEI